MTVNYREFEVTGTKWRRAKAVSISNPLNQPQNAWVSFTEEDVVLLNTNQTVSTEIGTIGIGFGDIESFNLLNPLTNEVVGTMTPSQLYAALYSLYMHVATERDNVPPTLQAD